nr:efflux transporter outer membrane subunit [Pseudomonas aeruginosa]ELQ7873435.1 efflux transporter outer membrane subunit [Pseudomonas aeruginosa]
MSSPSLQYSSFVDKPSTAWRKTAAAAICCAVLASCASIPDLGPMEKPASMDGLAADKSLEAPVGEWSTQAWWKSFGDPQLDQLMGEALANSPSMAQAQARLNAAIARSKGARAALFPSVSLDASASEQKLTYNSIFPRDVVPKGWNDYGAASLNFGWELDFWGKNRSALDAATSEALAVQADAAAARVLLTTELASRYVQLNGLHVQRDLARDTLRNREDSERMAMRRVDQGLDTQTMLEQAHARAKLARADLADVEERIELARNGIAALLGRGPDRGLDIHETHLSPSLSLALPETLKSDLIGRKPEIVAARWRVESAAKRIGVAKAGFYPSVNLVALVGYESLGLNRLFDSGSDAGRAGVAIHLPIFEGGRLRANYSRAWAEYEFAVASYNDALVQALRETADAVRSLQALPIRLEATESAVVSSDKAYQLAKRRYEGGLSNYQTVLTTEDAALNARMAVNALWVRGLSLDIALTKALGGGFSDSSMNEQVTR